MLTESFPDQNTDKMSGSARKRSVSNSNSNTRANTNVKDGLRGSKSNRGKINRNKMSSGKVSGNIGSRKLSDMIVFNQVYPRCANGLSSTERRSIKDILASNDKDNKKLSDIEKALTRANLRNIFMEIEKYRMERNKKNKDKDGKGKESRNRDREKEKRRNDDESEEDDNDDDIEIDIVRSKEEVKVSDELTERQAMDILIKARRIRLENTRNEQSIELILPNSFLITKFDNGQDFQDQVNKALTTLRTIKDNTELKWDTVGIENGNEYDLCTIAEKNFEHNKILKQIKPENIEAIDYQRHIIKIYFKDMHRIDKDWSTLLYDDLQENCGYVLHPLESIIINSGYRERTRTNNKILLKNVPLSYTYDGQGRLKPKDEIETNLKRILCKYNNMFNENLERVELMLIKPRNERIRTVYHNAKLIFKRTFDIKELCNKTIKIGFIESLLNEWKSKNDLKYENEPFLYAVMQTCNYCGSCEHDIWGCPRYVELR